jgi:hypothetical protein
MIKMRNKKHDADLDFLNYCSSKREASSKGSPILGIL